jgi:hypothetical protein
MSTFSTSSFFEEEIPDFKFIGLNHDRMVAQILQSGAVSDEEKAIIRQLNDLAGKGCLESDSAEDTSDQILSLINQLVSYSTPNHPYAYYYYFIRGTVSFFKADEEVANGAPVEQFASQLEAMIEDLSESIRLNADYADAYYVRGLLYGLTGKNDQGHEDLLTACLKGSKDAQAFIYGLFD